MYSFIFTTGPEPTTPPWVYGNCPSDEWDQYGETCFFFELTDTESWDDAIGMLKQGELDLALHHYALCVGSFHSMSMYMF